MVKTIIFDFDGTLVNTNDVIVDAWQHTYRHYIGKEMPREYIEKSFGEPLLITMAREFPEVPPEESASIYRQRQSDMADEMVKLFPGIVDMLDALKAAGIKMGVVTSRTRETTLFYMNKFSIAHYFDGLVSCDDTSIHKPNPEPLLLGLEKLGAKAEESIMVGDSTFDVKCANNAGVKAVLVGWRAKGGAEKLKECHIDFEMAEPMDILKIIKEA